MLGLAAAAVPAIAGAASLDAAIGQRLFERNWVSAPSSTKSDDGLGPLYDAPSCASCHAQRNIEIDETTVPPGIVVRLGNARGTGDSALYVPAGFTSHSPEPTPTDAAITFYYPRLGNLTNVTLAVFHVANFAITHEGGRIRIGNIGGPGGSFASYKHSHIEFYRGNTGLPSTSMRARLRIDPVTVFSSTGREHQAAE